MRIRNRKVGRLDVTFELLHQLLNLPNNAKIISVWHESDKDYCSISIESPYIKETSEGEMLPIITIKQLSGWDD